MKCVMCGATMTTSREPYKYKECGLPNVVLLDVEVRRCPSCGEEEAAIPAIERLHRAIAMAIVKSRRRLFPGEVRFLREYLGWSGAEFAKHMGVTRHQVSRWEHGTALSTVADRLVRALVLLRAPVDDYSVDTFAEIADETTKRPARVTLRRSKAEWRFDESAE